MRFTLVTYTGRVYIAVIGLAMDASRAPEGNMFHTQTINYTANRGHGVRLAVVVEVTSLGIAGIVYDVIINGAEYGAFNSLSEVANGLLYRLTPKEVGRLVRKF